MSSKMRDSKTTHDAEADDRNEHIKIYVNGEIVPKQDAVVSVYDSGFMLGDGVWEGLRLSDGTWAFLDEHLDRLFEAHARVFASFRARHPDIALTVTSTRLPWQTCCWPGPCRSCWWRMPTAESRPSFRQPLHPLRRSPGVRPGPPARPP